MSAAAAVAKRVTRALDSFFHVEASDTPDEYRVHSGSGNTYTVNLSEGTCTCPDGQRRLWCKHAYRVLFQTGETPPVEGVSEPEDRDDEPVATKDDEDGDTTTTDIDTDSETLAERVEHFEEQNPGASPLEVISRLGINPDRRERVEEVLAQ